MYYAYVHSKPHGEPFYVGKGGRRRVAEVVRNNKFHRDILSKYGVENVKVTAFPCASEKDAFLLETVIIGVLKGEGFRLANQTDGGEGTSGWAAPLAFKEQKRIDSLGKKNPFYGKRHTPERNAENAARAKIQWQDPALRKLHSERGKRLVGKANPFFGKRHTEESKRKVSETKRGKPGRKMTEAMKRDCSERVTGAKHHFYGKKLTAEHRAKVSESMSAATIGSRFMTDTEGQRRRAMRDKIAERVAQGWTFVGGRHGD